MSGWIAIPLSSGEFFSYKVDEWEVLTEICERHDGEITVNHYTFNYLFKRYVAVLKNGFKILIFGHHSDNRPGEDSHVSGYVIDASLHDTQSLAVMCSPYLKLVEEDLFQIDFQFSNQMLASLERIDWKLGVC